MARAGLGEDWTCVFANDNCPKKMASYAKNWGDEHFCLAGIETLASTDLPGNADLAWASFPCQDLSLAGSGAGLRGERSGTFWYFSRLLENLKGEHRLPKIVVLENVCGAITSHNGLDFQAIFGELHKLGYTVGPLVLNSVHFLPQSRPRLFIVGYQGQPERVIELARSRPDPMWHPRALTHAFSELPTELKESWVWWNLPQSKVPIKTLEDIIELEPTGVPWHSAEETRRLLNMMSPANRRKVEAAKAAGRRRIGTIYRRTRGGVQRAEVRLDGIAGCLRTPSGGSSRQIVLLIEGRQVRSRLLSAREAARLMGLGEEYVLPEKYNDAYHLVGDGLVVPAVSHLARNLLSKLAKYADESENELLKTA